MSDTADKDRPFLIDGADGKIIEIPASEYYFNTKARARRMCRNSLSKEARQVYACLELGTMGFQQELAVIQDQKTGKQRPLTTTDISRFTGLDDAHVRRRMLELDEEGLAERRGVDDGPLHKGKVEIYSWAEPRAAKERFRPRVAGIKGESPAWFPESWEPLSRFAKRYRFPLPEQAPEEFAGEIQATRGPLFEEAEKIARDLKEAEEAATRFLERVCAQNRINKEVKNKYREEKLASDPPAQPKRQDTPPELLRDHLEALARDQRMSLGPPNDQTVKNFWEIARSVPGLDDPPAIGDTIRKILVKNAGLTTWGGVFKEFRKTAEEANARGAS